MTPLSREHRMGNKAIQILQIVFRKDIMEYVTIIEIRVSDSGVCRYHLRSSNKHLSLEVKSTSCG